MVLTYFRRLPDIIEKLVLERMVGKEKNKMAVRRLNKHYSGDFIAKSRSDQMICTATAAMFERQIMMIVLGFFFIFMPVML